jgi:hypothetical protein
MCVDCSSRGDNVDLPVPSESEARRETMLRKIMYLTTLSAVCSCSANSDELHVPPTLPDSVTTSGESIYFGHVFPLTEIAETATYVYERRVEREPGLQISTHITRDMAGHVVLAESATESESHALLGYTLHLNQLGQTGAVLLDEYGIVFRKQEGGEEVSATEERSASQRSVEPVLVGPTLVGYLMRHLPELRSGSTLPVRLAVLDRLETIAFEVQTVEPRDANETRVAMHPSNPLYALAIDPVYFTFESAHDRLVSLEGRVPPKVWADNHWADFDARVEYHYVAEGYL